MFMAIGIRLRDLYKCGCRGQLWQPVKFANTVMERVDKDWFQLLAHFWYQGNGGGGFDAV